MTWRNRLIEAAAKHGGTIDWNDVEFVADVPMGHVWACSGGHSICELHNDQTGSFVPSACKSAIDSIGYGIQPCTTPDCDVCEDIPLNTKHDGSN